jgi:hypothetical protein
MTCSPNSRSSVARTPIAAEVVVGGGGATVAGSGVAVGGIGVAEGVAAGAAGRGSEHAAREAATRKVIPARATTAQPLRFMNSSTVGIKT